MRTTLDIDDDVLRAAKEVARKQGLTAGEVISRLARTGLSTPPSPSGAGEQRPRSVLGFRPFPRRGGVVTDDLIDRLREDDAY